MHHFPRGQPRRREVGRRAAGAVLANPPHSSVDPWSHLLLTAADDLVDVVLLHQPLHGTEISTIESHPRNLALHREGAATERRTPRSQLKDARSSERYTDNTAVVLTTLKERFIIGMPPNRIASILVEIEIHTVRPSFLGQITHLPKPSVQDGFHPIRNRLSWDGQTAVAVATSAISPHKPCRQPRQSTPFAEQAVPLSLPPNGFKLRLQDLRRSAVR
mmetsp:Transcript_77743/g.207692  ORF Transcript_77743/g.207692 Transcript_77743/m.207692 type:complete len:218 (-) Transcript_77743:180-833(-)